MPLARYRLVDIKTTPYYHCISRCVRRAFLCGIDRFSGKNFDHRKQWILNRVKQLSSVFAIDVCAYAIMSNHFHLVLHVDECSAKDWDMREVIDRWLQLYKGPLIAQRYSSGEPLTRLEMDALSDLAKEWRIRLSDLSWYMRCLNETIARMANDEDNCTGRFWEGRFRSQALLDEAALVSCMAYVDLNPIRAGVCDSLEASDFTSIQERIRRYTNKRKQRKGNNRPWLKPLQSYNKPQTSADLTMQLTDYFALVDWTGRAMREDKRGAIPAAVVPILQRLGVKEENWVTNTQHFGSRFYRALGRLNRIKELAKQTGQNWVHGQAQVKAFYS